MRSTGFNVNFLYTASSCGHHHPSQRAQSEEYVYATYNRTIPLLHRHLAPTNCCPQPPWAQYKLYHVSGATKITILFDRLLPHQQELRHSLWCHKCHETYNRVPSNYCHSPCGGQHNRGPQEHYLWSFMTISTGF